MEITDILYNLLMKNMDKNLLSFLGGAFGVFFPFALLKIDDIFSLSKDGSSVFQYLGTTLFFISFPVGIVAMIIALGKILRKRK